MAKSKAINPRALSDRVMALIERDVENLEKLLGIDDEISARLVRYLSALTQASKDFDAEKANTAKKLSQLSDKELREIGKRVLMDKDLQDVGL